jgi:hypothetical protein
MSDMPPQPHTGVLAQHEGPRLHSRPHPMTWPIPVARPHLANNTQPHPGLPAQPGCTERSAVSL